MSLCSACKIVFTHVNRTTSIFKSKLYITSLVNFSMTLDFLLEICFCTKFKTSRYAKLDERLRMTQNDHVFRSRKSYMSIEIYNDI